MHSIPFCNLVFVVYFIMGQLGHWVCRERWAHKRLFNLPPQFSRLGTQGPAFLFFRFVCCVFCVLCVLEVLSLLLSLARMLYTCFFQVT